jgi:hypothetical protein
MECLVHSIPLQKAQYSGDNRQIVPFTFRKMEAVSGGFLYSISMPSYG